MEIIFSISCLIFSITCIFLSTSFLKNKIKFHSKIKKRLPPGEMGLPWIGETMEFFRAQSENKLYEDFVKPRITKYGQIFKTRLMGSPTIIVNGAEANKFFLSNEFKLVISSWPTTSVQLMGKNCIMEKQGEKYKYIRALICNSFNNSGLEKLVPRICKSIEMHLQKNWNEVNMTLDMNIISLYKSARVLTFDIVFECLLGIKVEDGLVGIFERILEGVFAIKLDLPWTKFSRAKKARDEIGKFLVKIVREKRKVMEEEMENDGMLLCQFIDGMVRGQISEEEVIDNIVLLVFAAHDTTSFAIAMTFKMLAKYPNCYELLMKDHMEIMKQKKDGEKVTLEDTKKMKYTWQVARESMRLFPPIFGSFRKAIVDIQYEGYTIPKGWKILWTTHGTHCNEDYFKDPLSFKPSRFEEAIPPYAYLPFGGGPRLCAGYQLAKLNILIFVHYVVTRYNWSLVYPNEPIIMNPLPSPSHGMPIKVSPK